MSGKFNRGRSGPEHYHWNGGTMVNGKGYLRISCGPLKGAYVHRLVMEAKLGRKLGNGEQVHHINGDKLDCRPENLEVKLDSEHSRVSNYKRWHGQEEISGVPV